MLFEWRYGSPEGRGRAALQGMGQQTAMNGLVPGLGLGDPNAARLASLADPKQNKIKNNRNGYRAKELAEIRNSLRPFEQGDQIARSSLRQLNGDAARQLTSEQLRQLNDAASRQLNGDASRQLTNEQLRQLNDAAARQLNGETTKLRLNGEHLRQLNGELHQYDAEQLRYDAEQLRTVSSLSDGSSSESVIPVQETLKETLNKLALMGYDEVL